MRKRFTNIYLYNHCTYLLLVAPFFFKKERVSHIGLLSNKSSLIASWKPNSGNRTLVCKLFMNSYIVFLAKFFTISVQVYILLFWHR